MAEQELIAEVGDVRIIDDGYDDEDVYVEINGERVGVALGLSHYENMSQALSPHFNSALEEARRHFDGGSVPTINFESIDENIVVLDITVDYDVEKVGNGYTNNFVVYFNEEDVKNDDVVVNDNVETANEFDSNWYFNEVYIEEE